MFIWKQWHGVCNQLPLHADGNDDDDDDDDDDEDVSKHSSHRLIPVRFFCDLAPFSPFCFLLCRGRTTGNHFSGRSLRTVILSSLTVSVYVICAVSLTDDRRISARTRGWGWELRSQLRRSWIDRAPSRPCPSVSASPKHTHTCAHTRTHVHGLGPSLALFSLPPPTAKTLRSFFVKLGHSATSRSIC